MAAPDLSEALHKILDHSEDTQKDIQSIIDKVKLSNVGLEEVQNKLDVIVSENDANVEVNIVDEDEGLNDVKSEDFVGLEAGRLEVEKARLEAELSQAIQRIQVGPRETTNI